MTLYQLLNTCNASPDIEITVFTYAQFEHEGKYEDIDREYLDRKVNFFIVKDIDKLGYRSNITKMNIHLDRKEN